MLRNSISLLPMPALFPFFTEILGCFFWVFCFLGFFWGGGGGKYKPIFYSLNAMLLISWKSLVELHLPVLCDVLTQRREAVQGGNSVTTSGQRVGVSSYEELWTWRWLDVELSNNVFHLNYFLVLSKPFYFSCRRLNVPMKLEPFKEGLNENCFKHDVLVEHLLDY